MTTINLPIPPSTNNLYANPFGGKGRRPPTKRYRDWKENAGWELVSQRPPKIKGPVSLEYLFENGASKADLGNLEKAVTDLLVTHEVIEGDGPSVVREIRMRFAMGVKGVAATVINLRPQEAASMELVG